MTYATQTECHTALTQGSILPIPTANIYSNKPRSRQNSAKMLRLVQNIRKYGLSSPIVVAPTEVFPGTVRYLVVEGEELWHAACLAGLSHIPCLITQNAPQETEISAIFAQIASKSTDMFEQAALFRHLTDAYNLTQEEISRRTGLSQSAIANKMRLLALSATEQRKILLFGLSERHARALVRLKSQEARLSALDVISRKNLTVAATEALVETYLSPNTPHIPPKSAEITLISPQTNTSLPQSNQDTPEVKTGKRAPKLVLHTLQPLYNSLERTLNIFRKTGRKAILTSEETENELVITIRIPHP